MSFWDTLKRKRSEWLRDGLYLEGKVKFNSHDQHSILWSLLGNKYNIFHFGGGMNKTC